MGQPTKKLSAKEIVADIRAGMTDKELRAKYQLPL